MGKFNIGDTVVFKGENKHQCYITSVDETGYMPLYNGFDENGNRFYSCALIDYEKISIPSIKLSQIPSSQFLYIERDKYCDPEVMNKTDYMNSHYFLDKEPVNVFIAIPEVTRFTLYDWIEWLGEENYEDWAITVYDEIMKDPITNKFILLVNRVFKDHPTYYPGRLVEIDIKPFN